MNGRAAFHFLLVACAAILHLQCSKDVVTEERLADEAFTRAIGALDDAGYRAARPLLLDCLARERRLGRTRREAEVLSLLGESCSATASFDSAGMFLKLAEDRFRASGERAAARAVTLSLVSFLQQTGRARESFNLCAEALRLARLFRDTTGMQEIQLAMLPLCRVLGENAEESRILDDLSSTAGGRSGSPLLARAFLEAGITSRVKDRFEEGVQRFTRSLSIAGRGGDSSLAAGALMWLAVTSDATGKTREAFQYFGEAVGLASRLATAERFRCELMMRIGNAYLRYHQPGEARKFYRAALPLAQRVGDRIGEGYLALQLSRCDLETDAGEQALRSAESALSLFDAFAFAPGQAYALIQRAAVLEGLERIPQAIESYQTAVVRLEGVAADLPPEHPAAEAVRSVLPDGLEHAYVRLAELLLRTERYDDAFRIAERHSRYRVFRLAGALAPSAADPALQDLLTALMRARSLRIGSEQLHRRVLEGLLPPGDGEADRAAALQTAVRDYNVLRARIIRAAPRMAPLLLVEEVTLKEAQSRVPPSAALLVPVPTRRALYSFVVTRERIAVQLAAVDEQHLRTVVQAVDSSYRAVEAYADSIQMSVGPPDAYLRENLRLLAQWVLRPVQADLAGATRIIVVPPAELHRVPVHALRDGPLPSSPYLIESKIVTYLPSVSFLDPSGLPSGPVTDVAGMGFSDDGTWDVEYELRDIRAFYKEARLAFLDQADLTRLRREHHDLFHLAVAIRVDDVYPGNSSLVLSNGKTPPSGVSVQLGELTGLQPSPIVVLSNLSPVRTRLSQAVPALFLANGTRAIVLPQYIPMRKTKKLFSELLYTSLLASASIADAMQQLQKQMIRTPEFSSPLVWGSFCLVGN